MTTIDLEISLRTLHAKRAELLEQLGAIDTALAALAGAGMTVANTQESPQDPAAEVAGAVVPHRVKAPRVLSDEHRQALLEGRRKARQSHDAAAGHAREALDPSPAAPETAALPRLVKRAK